MFFRYRDIHFVPVQEFKRFYRGILVDREQNVAPKIMFQILIIQRLIMKWLPAFFLFILLLAMTAPATAAAGISDSVVQPVRTVIPVVTTPAVMGTPIIIQRTMTLTPVSVTITCSAPALCIAEQDAAARWGQNNYTRDSDTSCGTGAAVSREIPPVLYCFRQISPIGLARTAPTVPIGIATTVTQVTIQHPG